MKNNHTKSVLSELGFFILGMVLGAGLILMTQEPETSVLTPLTLIILICLSAAAIVQGAKTIIEGLVIPYITKKKAAVRALGKHGIRVVRRDDTAKIAYKGILALLNGDIVKSEELLQKALSLSDVRQNQLFCLEWLRKLYEDQGNDTKLLWCYRKAVEYAPEDPEFQTRLGHYYYVDGKLDQAIYCMEQALRYDPNSGYAYYILAKIALIRGENQKVREVLEKLGKINENHPLYHMELAEYYAMQGDSEKAEEECKKSMLCGNKEPDELNKRINAMLSFHNTEYDGNNLPIEYYRRREKKRSEKPVHSGGTGVINND